VYENGRGVEERPQAPLLDLDPAEGMRGFADFLLQIGCQPLLLSDTPECTVLALTLLKDHIDTDGLIAEARVGQAGA
jgi:hypothetical protein